MNLAILVLDFLSYDFEEANISYCPLCDSCDLDSLPFIIEIIHPVDYGKIFFKYSHNEDTLFYATIIWMGTGEIILPDQFTPSSEFEYQPQSIALPDNVQYFDFWLIPGYYSEERFKEKADSAWMAIDSLQLVNEFAEYTYRVGIYAYTPTIGEVDPYVAKWIIFLYYGNDYPTGTKDLSMKINSLMSYPNPLTTSTNLSYTLDKPSTVTITIFNPQGQLIERIEQEQPKGENQQQWNAEGLPAGMYYFRIQAGDKVGGGKIVKISDS